ncbi:MAG: phosphoribosyltransferase [Bdellovibrio sp. CG10_big_fil_rev_8_21_14_0_10_47_8]|nr:MAG: phosphoribosyltransferase [Bdellovibrio sp. CG10_big_fil_rev_8_21_14_0_10_47_8]
MIFLNRIEAGDLLAEKLLKYKSEEPVILALPRGGVPVAAKVAQALDVPLEVLVVRKIGAPFNVELAVGAICEASEPTFSERLMSRAGLSLRDLVSTVQSEEKEIQRQIHVFREGHQLPTLTGRTVIIVDDGLATGATVLAAVKYLKRKRAQRIVVATPVASASSARCLRGRVHELIALEEREDLRAVGNWYEDFSAVSDQEVIFLLQSRREELKAVKRTP